MTSSLSYRYTRNLFLRAFCTVYLSAFLSFYYQAPGLYGDHGVLPARSVLENSKHNTLSARIHYQPTLLWLAPYLGLSTSAALDVLALLGAFLAFTGIVSQKFCIVPVFTALWSLFFSLFQIGQVFVSNNYDELLLEAGFLAILVAPLWPNRRRSNNATLDLICFWLCRLLVFRVLFAAVAKLLSGCPKWWALSALNYHFETMPLPNPLSWSAHNLPPWILRLGTVYTIVCELAVPLLFFWPASSVKNTAFHLQLILQTCIVATGNFGHANILIVTLLLSLLHDQYFYKKRNFTSSTNILETLQNAVVWSGLIFGSYYFFGLKFREGTLEAQIAFTKTQFNALVETGLPLVVLLLVISFLVVAVRSIYQVLYSDGYSGSRAAGLVGAIFFTLIGAVILFSSSAALLSIHPKTNSTIVPEQRSVYNRMHKAHVVNQYNLFPQISGVDGRPEIILEGANNLEGPWKEYNLLYKPGNVNHSLPFVAPYSPRLDWQFYWAARSTYDKQPWLLSLTHRLLTGSSDVLNLIDRSHLPFATPPKYIRGVLYKYKFPVGSQRSQRAWWVREKVGEYFPPQSKDSPVLEDYLRARNLFSAGKPQPVHPAWKTILDSIRQLSNKFEGALLFWSVLAAACAIILSRS